jgi:hypothetical protein
MPESEANNRTDFYPLYPRVALASTLGILILLASTVLVGVIGEFAEGSAHFVLGLPVAALGIFLFGRFATVRVSKMGDSGVKIRNPFRTHRLDCGEIASIRVSGFVYKWLTLQTRDGRNVPVAASVFVLAPREADHLAMNKFLEECAQQSPK